MGGGGATQSAAPHDVGVAQLVFACCNNHLSFMTINSKEFQPSRNDDNRLHAPSPMEGVTANRMRCPNCNLPAIAPMVSTYLRECMVENDWVWQL
jgi:hypothetical protein